MGQSCLASLDTDFSFSAFLNMIHTLCVCVWYYLIIYMAFILMPFSCFCDNLFYNLSNCCRILLHRIWRDSCVLINSRKHFLGVALGIFLALIADHFEATEICISIESRLVKPRFLVIASSSKEFSKQCNVWELRFMRNIRNCTLHLSFSHLERTWIILCALKRLLSFFSIWYLCLCWIQLQFLSSEVYKDKSNLVGIFIFNYSDLNYSELQNPASFPSFSHSCQILRLRDGKVKEMSNAYTSE